MAEKAVPFHAPIEGIKIKTIRLMTKAELSDEGWQGQHIQLIELENGVKLYPSADYEGNGGGALFGTYKRKQFGI